MADGASSQTSGQVAIEGWNVSLVFAAERLNVAPYDCLVIEDSVHGTVAAQAAGMPVVGFCGGSHCKIGHAERLLGAGCMRVFARMSDFGEFVQSLDPDQ